MEYGIIGFSLMFLPGIGLSSYYIARHKLPPFLVPFVIILTVVAFPLWLLVIMITTLVYPKQHILELAFVALALEGMLEAAPQAILQSVSLMEGNIPTPTIIFAIVTSIFTVSKVAVQFHYWTHHIDMNLFAEKPCNDEETPSPISNTTRTNSTRKKKTIQVLAVNVACQCFFFQILHTWARLGRSLGGFF